MLRADPYAQDRNDERRKLAGEADPANRGEIAMLRESLRDDPLSETARRVAEQRVAFLEKINSDNAFDEFLFAPDQVEQLIKTMKADFDRLHQLIEQRKDRS